MSAARFGRGRNRVNAQLVRDGRELFNPFLVHVPLPFGRERSGDAVKGKLSFENKKPSGIPGRLCQIICAQTILSSSLVSLPAPPARPRGAPPEREKANSSRS